MIDSDIIRLAASRSVSGNVLKLCEELGELAQAAAKYWDDPGNPKRRQDVVEEMADVLICIDLICHQWDISNAELTDMRHHKMLRNMARLEARING